MDIMEKIYTSWDQIKNQRPERATMPISTHHQEHSKSQTGSSEWPVQWCRRGSGNVEDFFDKTRHSLWGSQHLLLTCVQNTQWLYVSPGEKKEK